MTNAFNEAQKQHQFDKQADAFYEVYRDQMDALEKSPISKIRQITPYDVYCLGKQLKAYEDLQSFKEAEGTVATLGLIPTIAFDVITASYGSSPISALASVQPIDEEQGLIYYRSVYARTTRGNVTAGQRIVSQYTPPDVQPLGFAGTNTSQTLATTASATLSYTGTLAQAPLRPGSVRIAVAGSTSPTYDDGKGNILGRDFTATVDYTTGATTVKFIADPGASHAITVTYSTDFEAASDLPHISSQYDTRMVKAEIYALKALISLPFNYVMQKRFGRSAEEDVAADLVAAINAEIANNLIVKLAAASTGTAITWTRTNPGSISNSDYKQGIFDVLVQADNQILTNAGRGNTTTLVAGLNAAGIISTLPGFVKIAAGNVNAPHIWGTLNGMTVVRVPDATILATNTVLCVYNGTSPFDSAAIYAPYMPLTVTNTEQVGNNPLVSHRGAVVWAAVDVLVPAFVTTVNFV